MRTKKTVVVLISGKAGAGKTTVSELLQALFKNLGGLTVFTYSFASPLKYIAKAYLGWDGEKDDRGRQLLQKLGQLGREYEPVIWVRHLLNQMDKKAGMFPFDFVLVDDFRFPNEVTHLQSNPVLDVITVRVDGRGGLENPELALEESENSLPTDPTFYDFHINNSGTLDDLSNKVGGLLTFLLNKFVV